MRGFDSHSAGTKKGKDTMKYLCLTSLDKYENMQLLTLWTDIHPFWCQS